MTAEKALEDLLEEIKKKHDPDRFFELQNYIHFTQSLSKRLPDADQPYRSASRFYYETYEK